MRSSNRAPDGFELELAATLSSVARPRLSEDFDRQLRARLQQEEPSAQRRVFRTLPTLPVRTRMLVRLYFGAAAIASLAIAASMEIPASLSPVALASILIALAFSLTPLWMMQRACPRLFDVILRTVR